MLKILIREEVVLRETSILLEREVLSGKASLEVIIKKSP